MRARPHDPHVLRPGRQGREGPGYVPGRTAGHGLSQRVTEAQWRVILRTCRRVFRAGRAGLASGRRTARDYERLPASREAMILWAMITLMANRLAQLAELSNAHLAYVLT